MNSAGAGPPPRLPRSRTISPRSSSTPRSTPPPPLEAGNLRAALNELRRTRKTLQKLSKNKKRCNKTRRNFQHARNNLHMKALAVANANLGNNLFY
jgi:hypothetical protein